MKTDCLQQRKTLHFIEKDEVKMAPSIGCVAHEVDIVIAHEPDFVDLGAFGEEMETPSIESGR